MLDSETFLNKAYKDLIEACTQIADYRWADDDDVERLSWYLSEVKYWTMRVKESSTSVTISACPTVQ